MSKQKTIELCTDIINYIGDKAIGKSEISLNLIGLSAIELRDKVKSEVNLLSEVENEMERWHLGRDNDGETLQKINDLLYSAGYLKWFNQKKENDNGN
jgi:hypothetical protein